MKIMPSKIPDIFILEPKVFSDERGFFLERYNAQIFEEIVGFTPNFVQDNHSRSSRRVLRGLHYQIHNPQGKLVWVTHGRVFDVAVDLRRSSKTFGQWEGVELSEHNHLQMWIPPGFAHGFVVLSETADFLYKSTDFYAPQHERCLKWDDGELGIKWPIDFSPSLSSRDRHAGSLSTIETFL